MKFDHQCRWTRDRLPLLDGGEIAPDDRRKVERHLIGCPDCRDRREVAGRTLGILRSAAQVPSTREDAPSLWPALARQIRESRHLPTVQPTWRDRVETAWSTIGPVSWPALGLAVSLGGLMAVAILSQTVMHPPASILVDRPIAAPAGPEPSRVAPTDRKPEPPPLRPIGLLTQGKPDPFQPPPSLGFEYELERGTPTEPGNRDPHHSY